jgi:hypothetical protein
MRRPSTGAFSSSTIISPPSAFPCRPTNRTCRRVSTIRCARCSTRTFLSSASFSAFHRPTFCMNVVAERSAGRLARGIENRLLREFNEQAPEILPYPLQRGLVRELSVAAEAAGRPEGCRCGPAKARVFSPALMSRCSCSHSSTTSRRLRAPSATGARSTGVAL